MAALHRAGLCAAVLCAGGSLAACALGAGGLDGGPDPAGACGSCHAEQAGDVRVARLHRSGGEGCLLCHAPHAGTEPGAGPAGLRARCEDCHAPESAQFALPFRHPLAAGPGCSACHPPHGLAPRELREHLRTDACVECHREYEGPFQFEHEGDRTLGCLSCHEPHGSSNRRLLTHADTRELCFSCHIHLEDTHLQNPGSPFRQCLACHTEVHGSNWDRELMR